MLNKMHNGLCVCIRLKHHAFRGQFVLEFQEVFNNTVLHNDDALRLSEVRMSVACAWRTVSCPTRMTNTWRAINRRFANKVN